MMSQIKVGSAWVLKETGDCVIVVSANRTGHQYDRYWLLEVMRSDGSISQIEDYALLSNYSKFESQDQQHDSSTF